MKINQKTDHEEYFRSYGIQFTPKHPFTVDDYGTLFDRWCDEEASRREVYDSDRYEFSDLEGLVRCVANLRALWMVIDPVYERFAAETGKRLPEDPDFAEYPDDILDAARLFGKRRFVNAVKAELEDWLDDYPDPEREDSFDSTPDPMASAYRYFRSSDACKKLDIEIVEGEHPGSSYYAARLVIDVDEANERCRKLNLPYEFREE